MLIKIVSSLGKSRNDTPTFWSLQLRGTCIVSLLNFVLATQTAEPYEKKTQEAKTSASLLHFAVVRARKENKHRANQLSYAIFRLRNSWVHRSYQKKNKKQLTKKLEIPTSTLSHRGVYIFRGKCLDRGQLFEQFGICVPRSVAENCKSSCFNMR